MTKIAMVLSGCGHLDGAEIREAVLSILFLDQQGAEVDFFAPDIAQREVVDSLSLATTNESRNVLHEAARIARGNISSLAKLDMKDYDGLVVPGGFGVAKNLSDLAYKGKDAEVLPEFKKCIIAAHAANKPIAAICIAPAVVAAALKGVAQPRLTIGDDQDMAAVIQSFGAIHVNAPSGDCVIDEKQRIVTCSAYMREDLIAEIADGIEKTIRQLVKWTGEKDSTKAA